MRPLLACLILLAIPRLALGCLFCEALASTLSDDIRESAACVIAQWDRDAAAPAPDIGMQLAKFRVTKVLKGDGRIGSQVDAYILPDEPPTGPVLLFAFGDPDAPQWSAPLPLAPVSVKYLNGLQTAPAAGSDRLGYFLPFLVAEDRHVADDAYNEFARAPFADIQGLGDRLDRQWVLDNLQSYLKDDKTPPHRIRLMWTLLSVCGEPEDAALVQRVIDDKTIDRNAIGWDAALGCYMSLAGPAGLEQVKQLLSSSDDEQTLFMALNAIRFHAVETKRFDQTELAAALHPLLRNVRLAAYVIPDLARMEDWTVGPRLLELYASPDAAPIRIHIVNYFRTSPRPDAAESLATCRELDPTAVRRAELLFGNLRPRKDQ
ncbi:hypothetical protein [Rosistilla oblonga]|uniref:hypothetical protein n=1 Tax=Rosistilla oblonga TaxID=2527990 RepID=UPI003A97450D